MDRQTEKFLKKAIEFSKADPEKFGNTVLLSKKVDPENEDYKGILILLRKFDIKNFTKVTSIPMLSKDIVKLLSKDQAKKVHNILKEIKKLVIDQDPAKLSDEKREEVEKVFETSIKALKEISPTFEALATIDFYNGKNGESSPADKMKNTTGLLAEYDNEIIKALLFCGVDVTFDPISKKWDVKDPGIDMENGRGIIAKNSNRHIRFKKEDAEKIVEHYLSVSPNERKGVITAAGIFKLFNDYVTEYNKDNKEVMDILSSKFSVDGPEWVVFNLTSDSEISRWTNNMAVDQIMFSEFGSKRLREQKGKVFDDELSADIDEPSVPSEIRDALEGLESDCGKFYSSYDQLIKGMIDSKRITEIDNKVDRFKKLALYYKSLGNPTEQKKFSDAVDVLENAKRKILINTAFRVKLIQKNLEKSENKDPKKVSKIIESILKSFERVTISEIEIEGCPFVDLNNVYVDGQSRSIGELYGEGTEGYQILRETLMGLDIGEIMGENLKSDKSVNVLYSIMDLSVSPGGKGLPCGELIASDMIFDRTSFLMQKDQILGKLFEKYKSEHPGYKPEDFENFVDEIIEKFSFTDEQGNVIKGNFLFDRDSLMAANPDREELNKTDPNNEYQVKFNTINSKSDKAYVMMDRVSRMIERNSVLNQKYENADENGKADIVKSFIKYINENMPDPTPEEISAARSRWQPVCAQANLLSYGNEFETVKKSFENCNPAVAKYFTDSIDALRARNSKRTANSDLLVDEEYENSSADTTASDTASSGESENESDKEELVKFGKLYPREEPAYKIAKKFKPYNVKATLKFLDKLLEELDKVDVVVETPKYQSGGAKLKTEEEEQSRDSGAGEETSAPKVDLNKNTGANVTEFSEEKKQDIAFEAMETVVLNIMNMNYKRIEAEQAKLKERVPGDSRIKYLEDQKQKLIDAMFVFTKLTENTSTTEDSSVFKIKDKDGKESSVGLQGALRSTILRYINDGNTSFFQDLINESDKNGNAFSVECHCLKCLFELFKPEDLRQMLEITSSNSNGEILIGSKIELEKQQIYMDAVNSNKEKGVTEKDSGAKSPIMEAFGHEINALSNSMETQKWSQLNEIIKEMAARESGMGM